MANGVSEERIRQLIQSEFADEMQRMQAQMRQMRELLEDIHDRVTPLTDTKPAQTNPGPAAHNQRRKRPH